MNIAKKIKEIFEASTGLPLVYGTEEAINRAIGTGTLPCGLLKLIGSGTVTADGGLLVEEPRVSVAVVNLTQFDADSYDNEDIITACKTKLYNFILAVQSSRDIALEAVTECVRLYEIYDDIVTGIFVTMRLREVYGVSCPDGSAPVREIKITGNGTYNVGPYDVAIVDVQGGTPAVVEPLEVTPDTEAHTFTPPAGVDGFAPVVVGACPVCPSPVLQAKTAEPATTAQVVTADEGYDGLSSVTVDAVTAAIDANITPGNIKQGVEILGVEGTLEPIGIYWRAFLLSINCDSPLSNNSFMPDEITSITDDVGVVTRIGSRRIGSGVTYLNLPEAVNYGTYPLSQASHIEEVYIPKITGLIPIGGLSELRILRTGMTALSSNYFNGVNKLCIYECGTVTTWNASFVGKTKLREVIVGANTAVNLPLRWSPTDVIAEGPAAIAELNANIVAGLADRVADRTNDTALTITFGASLYNVLTADTIAAFTAKNWNVASA